MKKITLCLMLIVALVLPVAVLATEPVVNTTVSTTTTVEKVSTEKGLRDALEAGKDVELEGDIKLANKTSKEGYTNRNAAIVIDGEGSVTIKGNGHTISFDAARTIFEIYATGTKKLDVTFENVKLEANAAGGRCINTYTGNINLNINNSSLKTTKGSYDQTLTIGGDSASNINVNITNSSISAESHYAIIAFNPIKLKIDGCRAIGGFTALYMKEGSKGSEVNINNSELIGRNKWAAASGSFGTIVLEDENVKIDINESTLSAIEDDTALEYIIQDKVGGNTITARRTTINAATTSMSIKNTTKITLGDQTVLKDSSIPNVDALNSFLVNGAVAKLTAKNEYTVFEPHTITIKEVAGGKVIVREVPTSNTVKEIDKAISGETVEVVVEPAEGYKFKGISGVDGLKDVAEYAYQFVMPNKDVVLTPVFEKITTEAEVPKNVANAEKVEEMLVETLKENKELAEIIKDKNVEIKVEVKEKEVTSSEKEAIETAASKEVADIKVTNYIDITIYVKDADNGKNLGNLETVKEAITFTVPVPEDLPELAEGFTRIFYIVREHDGDIDVWEVKEADGKLSFESDKFSTYAIAYKDVKTTEGGVGEDIEDNKTENKPATPDVPKTGDNVVVYVALALVAITGMAVAIKVRKRK